ncbi:STAS domain-containing protein [Streptomyces sp. ISL-11]|uniref:STAS domain-containing protein n=1 Tax=Streptomyces sp. ISL-11 TaxID=2819174 RepID=UPI001BE8DA00|nr:STAS domain-containing protein [Streptomyces sp. ISL-11]MBT2383721.1 STAS domain-containing protein [Streptomyces sp. ISL-11]
MKVPTRVMSVHCVVTFPDVVDIENAPGIRDALRTAIRTHGDVCRTLVADLSASRFATATALSVLVEARNLARTKGMALYVVAPAPLTRKVFTLTGLREVMPLYRSLDEMPLPPAG